MRRRLFIIALALLLLLCLMLGVVFRFVAEGMRRYKVDAAARQVIADNGCAFSKMHPITVFAPQTGGGERAFDDQHLSAIIPSLRIVQDFASLDLHGSSVTDAGVAQLASLSELQSLDVSDTPVTVNGLLALQHLPKLGWITISPGQLSEDDLVRLNAAFPRVKKDFRGDGSVLLRPPSTSPATRAASSPGV